MSDRKLLELAAKAIGAKRTREEESNGYFQVHHWHEGYEDDWEYWNPLTQDGDAFELAVKMKFTVGHDMDFPTGPIAWIRQTGDFGGKYEWAERHEDNAQVATRRAIVTATANIGKAMP
jgi:hypothetical protein